MPENHFGERVADGYDAASAEMFHPPVVKATVDVLAGLAGDGRALELGIGTGRLALPLHERGTPVHGIDLSPAMVERLRAKPGSRDIAVTIGDFATTRADGPFTLVYLVHNTIMNLTSQDEQVECFRNAAAHLEPDGHFVVEVAVPALRRLPPGETARAFAAGPTHVGVDEYVDTTAQLLHSHHFRVVGGEIETFSAPFRYVWPSELDLMARLAGLNLASRWATWTREPFTSESTSHVSVWQKST